MAERKNCMMCTGMGHFDTWSKPCPESSMHKEMDCPLCKGNCYVFGDWKQCETCSGKGGLDTWGNGCLKIDMHWEKACHMCDGVGYTSMAADPKTKPVPTPQAPAVFEGQWRNLADPDDISTIVLVGPSKFMMTNPTQSWSPSYCTVLKPSVVLFIKGGLYPKTATINAENTVLTLGRL
eukprot:TRINITY_DN1029_c0_g3_i1.p1 TRINITY_DN1029_c0_g3~~TRINITY_DN1029_c0_g3_i1.p1  ORF type:complete len:179 (+),score=46.56 TRINITY_DN1029_c0_g3_i1:46-582(+)